ncbi:hypothetical protein AB6735_03710 [Mucilaginibacter sp. RCC_168]|uniref:hypothetical protein n=1 Tax=Mucilaginibacter sp. RCC_168 TaxID=3239221 RepID=UPI0035255B74
MSHLANKTERRAIKVLANTLRFFDDTDLLFVSVEDAFKAKQAENILRSIIESNGYKARYQKGKGTIIFKDRTPKYYENELF